MKKIVMIFMLIVLAGCTMQEEGFTRDQAQQMADARVDALFPDIPSFACQDCHGFEYHLDRRDVNYYVSIDVNDDGVQRTQVAEGRQVG